MEKKYSDVAVRKYRYVYLWSVIKFTVITLRNRPRATEWNKWSVL